MPRAKGNHDYRIHIHRRARTSQERTEVTATICRRLDDHMLTLTIPLPWSNSAKEIQKFLIDKEGIEVVGMSATSVTVRYDENDLYRAGVLHGLQVYALALSK